MRTTEECLELYRAAMAEREGKQRPLTIHEWVDGQRRKPIGDGSGGFLILPASPRYSE